MTESTASQLPDEAIVLGARADDWRGAVRLAGDALVASGVTTDEYTQEMIETVETLGPYIVIAPGFALAHSRPSRRSTGPPTGPVRGPGRTTPTGRRSRRGSAGSAGPATPR